jgi:protein-arginine kinase activator protein McsA
MKKLKKRIDELERLTQKLLYESNKTYEEAQNVQYEIKKLKDELNTKYDL